MLGFSVVDKKENCEIEYTKAKPFTKILKINGLWYAAQDYDLKPSDYSFRIRRISDGNLGKWSATYLTALLD